MSLRDQKDVIVEEFRKKLQDEFKLEDYQVYSQLILFQNKIYQDYYVRFKTIAEISLEIQSVTYNGGMNRYKKCVYCGLIWFRVYGCDSITCGKRSVSKDTLIGRFFNFTINTFKGVMNIKKILLIKKKNFVTQRYMDSQKMRNLKMKREKLKFNLEIVGIV